ncbi:MAG: prolyl oligopeptidase family serine peptidase [Candidatus Aminicenantes bacterium]|nr:prolyl oligopeptidase family serine peptidase [Candidatus Aminicenantes bacterium]
MNSSISKRRSSLFCIFILLFVFFMFQQAQSFTLENILSYAFPSSLVVSPKGDLVAWVFNWQGKRNIWAAKAPEYKARQLTAYSLDDGQELGGLAFDSEGKIIVYVRGGSANRAGENPNPTSNPEGTEQAVWAIKIEGGEPWRLGKGSNPVPSPVGYSVAFTLRGKIYLTSLDESSKPKLLFKARGRNRSPTWSPDASKLAFVSSREDHSFIGIYDLKGKSISWISPSVDRDSYPVWSPDGKNIAFIRFAGSMGRPSFRGGAKFTLMVADVNSGKAKEIWQCPNETGGFSQYYPSKTLRWAAEDCLVFYSEHEKWMHLYSISVKDKKIICLTPGEYEAEESFLSADGKTLIFNSNSGDIDRRHLWSIPVTGGKAKLLTAGEGVEWAPVLASNGKDLVFFCSTASQPAAPAVMSLKGKKKRLIAPEAIPAQFPGKDLVKPQQVIFKAPDGLKIHSQLFLPKGAKPGDKRPAAIFMHGGPIRQMLLGWHNRGYYHGAYALNQYLAYKGYVVLAVNFRSGIGYGYDFRRAPDQGPRGASEYQDIVAAGQYLQKRPEVDPSKIGLWGGSYGGYLTALGLARDSELFAAGVDLHGVHDWSLRGRRREGGGWGISGEDLMSSAYQSSPVADVYYWSSPVLFIHGDDDRNVDFIQTTDLVQRLRKLGKAHIEILIFPDEVHSFLRHDIWLKVYKATADFFDRFLK